MKHLDLFSGIGGFALAAREVWKDEYQTIGFVDNDQFCQSVLAKNFPGIPIYGDIRTLTNTDSGFEQSDKEVQTGRNAPIYVDLITGGFPCQPFSAAGRRRGTEDDRYLWPEMFRVIREFKPRWVIAENVAGLITWSNGLVLEQVCTDLESEGFEIQPFIIPAVSVNAPHRRDRVWIIAYNASKGLEGKLQRYGEGGKSTPKKTFSGNRFDSDKEWQRDWYEVAFATCNGGVDDGLPKRLVRLPNGTTISYSRWRKEALKAYGNSIVPQVAMEIMKAIKDVEGENMVETKDNFIPLPNNLKKGKE